MNTKMFSAIKKIQFGIALISGLLVTANVCAGEGWSVKGSNVIDPNGNPFVFRGINHAHLFWDAKTAQAIKDIAATDANSVRIGLSNGEYIGPGKDGYVKWTRTEGSRVSEIIKYCTEAKLVCVLEVHDSTGYNDENNKKDTWNNGQPAHISKATGYWTSPDIVTALKGSEDHVIINIANEPYGNGAVDRSTYVSDTTDAIKAIRGKKLTNLIMVDAPNWGQDSNKLMSQNAYQIFSADKEGKTMFSVHMYETFKNYDAVKSYVEEFRTNTRLGAENANDENNKDGLALIVGEFAMENNKKDVDAKSIMKYAQNNKMGYIGWSWSGNGDYYKNLDITYGWNPKSLTPWGEVLINDANGIKKTSELATNFTGKSPGKSSAAKSSVPSTNGQQCKLYASTYNVCVSNKTVDPATGWGFENNESCVSRAKCTPPYGTIIGGSSSKSSTGKSSAASSAKSSSPGSTASGTCGRSTFNKTAVKGADFTAVKGDCIKYTKSSGTLQIGSWSGVASSYTIGSQNITNNGSGWTTVANAANGDVYIKVVSASASLKMKIDNW